MLYTESDKGHLPIQGKKIQFIHGRNQGYKRRSQSRRGSCEIPRLGDSPLLPPREPQFSIGPSLAEAALLCGLAPLGPDTDQRADGTSEADQAVVEIGDAHCGDGDGQIAQVGDELYPGGGALPVNTTDISMWILDRTAKLW